MADWKKRYDELAANVGKLRVLVAGPGFGDAMDDAQVVYAGVERLQKTIAAIKSSRLRSLAATCPGCGGSGTNDWDRKPCDHGARHDPILRAIQEEEHGHNQD